MRHYLHLVYMMLVAGFLLFSVHAEDVNLTGRVTDASIQSGIAGAIVSLAGLQNFIDTTDANGAYSITGSDIRFLGSNNQRTAALHIRKKNLFFSIANNGVLVRIDLYNLFGRHVASLVNERLGAGTYRVNPYKQELASQLYFIKLIIGTQTFLVKMPVCDERSIVSSTPPGETHHGKNENLLAIIAAVDDTIVITASGYRENRFAITSYVGVNDVALAWQGYTGTVSINYTYYQSFAQPMEITVIDTDLVDQTVPVNVKSATDPVGITVPLDQVTGTVGQYAGAVSFTLTESDANAPSIQVSDGDILTVSYIDTSPVDTMTVNAQWNGVAGSVQPGMSIYKGAMSNMEVTLYDPDIIDSTATVHLKSERDTVGIDMTMHVSSGSVGTFTGEVGFSLTASEPGAAIAVKPAGDNLVLSYNDEAPVGVRIGTVMWFPVEGTIFLDSVGYHSIASTMTVVLDDSDLGDSTVAVTVASQKDTTGIDLSLSAVAGSVGTFKGAVGFSLTESSTGIIAVHTSDTVTVRYEDSSPSGIITKKAFFVNTKEK